MLLVEVPHGRLPERQYAINVVLGEHLGLPFHVIVATGNMVRLSVEGKPGYVAMPDTLFSASDTEWLTSQSMPKLPLLHWTSYCGGFSRNSGTPLPILYGRQLDVPSFQPPHNVVLQIDVFASVFFMLTRYEEVVVGARDEHDRFPASASIAYNEGFLTRPIVDEYVEMLWQAMSLVWPGLKRKIRTGRTLISCDVDFPLSPRRTLSRVIRKLGADLLRERSIKLASRRLLGYAGFDRLDPYNTFEWMMEVNERSGNQVTFFFVADRPLRDIDPEYDISSDFILRLMKRIRDRGHLIGLHGSYSSYASANQLRKEFGCLQSAMMRANIQQDEIGGRQHYLRWSTSITPSVLAHTGVTYDTTLGYAQIAGYRCGTCREFPLFDLHARRELPVRERPLLVMEGTLHSEQYMGLGVTPRALEVIDSLKQTVRLFDGDFTLLWHNSELVTEQAREHYVHAVS